MLRKGYRTLAVSCNLLLDTADAAVSICDNKGGCGTCSHAHDAQLASRGTSQQTRQAHTNGVNDNDGAVVGRLDVAWRAPAVGVPEVEYCGAVCAVDSGIAVLRSRQTQGDGGLCL